MNYDIAQPGSYVRDKRTGQHYTVIARIGCGNTPTDDIVLSYTTSCSLSKFLEGYEAATPGTYERGSLQPADDSAPLVSCGTTWSDELFDWIAPLLGREVVWLQDFDGEVNKRWAKKTPFGLTCWRMALVSKVVLLPDGKVAGASYVASWKPARSS